MENPNYYAVIPADVRYDKSLRPNEKLLYGEITALTQKTGECWASNNYFADLYGRTPQAISKWILDLEKRGYITIEYIKAENSNNIEKRIIRMVSTNIDRVSTKNGEGYQQKFKENNTSINNKKKKKEDRNFQEELKNVIEFYENNITLITQFISEDMDKYLHDGLYADLIIEAMKDAVSRNKRNWKYVASILNDCINNKVYTAEQFKIKQQEFKSNSSQSTKKAKTTEKVEYEEVTFTEEEYNKIIRDG
ncbi:MAG: helix-turn-helix domain-containing protein [Clostridia bacterium]|nr:helix-turn-helix domain-containing protein [Clostridia bacterium]